MHRKAKELFKKRLDGYFLYKGDFEFEFRGQRVLVGQNWVDLDSMELENDWDDDATWHFQLLPGGHFYLHASSQSV